MLIVKTLSIDVVPLNMRYHIFLKKQYIPSKIQHIKNVKNIWKEGEGI